MLSESQTIRLDHQPLPHTPSAQPVHSTVCLTDCTLSVHQPAIPCAQQPSKASQSVEARRQKLGETLPGTFGPLWSPRVTLFLVSGSHTDPRLRPFLVPGTLPDPRVRLFLVPGTPPGSILFLPKLKEAVLSDISYLQTLHASGPNKQTTWFSAIFLCVQRFPIKRLLEKELKRGGYDCKQSPHFYCSLSCNMDYAVSTQRMQRGSFANSGFSS